MTNTATLESLKALAQYNLAARREGARIANAITDYAQRMVAVAALPKALATHGAVQVSAMVPENRTKWRQTHVRFTYRVAGKVVKEAQARAVLVGG